MANGTNIANLNATLTLEQFEFQNGLKQAESRALKSLETIDAASNKTNNAISNIGKGGGGFSGGGAARSVQQIGFAMQDFHSQLETRGFGGAIGAVTNNVQMLGASFGPVGMAVTAVGGALAGILLPKLIESSGLFKDGREEVKSYTDALNAWRTEMERVAKLQKDTLSGGTKGLDKDQTSRQSELEMLQAQQAELEQQYATQNAIIADREKHKARMSVSDFAMTALNPGAAIGLGSPFENTVNYTMDSMQGESQAESRKKAIEKELNEVLDQRAKLERDMKQAESLRPKIEGDEQAAKDLDRKKADLARENEWQLEQFEQRREAAVKAEEEVSKFRTKALETYGDEYQKLQSKQLRERKEFEEKIAYLRTDEQSEAMQQFNAQQAADMQKVRVSMKEQAIGKLGPDAKGSAGADLASSEGIQAINRAISGRGENDVLKEQLAVEQKQLDALNQMARMATDPDTQKAMEFANNEASLGPAQTIGTSIRNGGWTSYNKWGELEGVGSTRTPNSSLPIGESVDDQEATLKDMLKLYAESKYLLKEIADKTVAPVMKYVALSG